MRGMNLSHSPNSPDPPSLKPPKYASFMQIENDASSVVRSFLFSLLLLLIAAWFPGIVFVFFFFSSLFSSID